VSRHPECKERRLLDLTRAGLSAGAAGEPAKMPRCGSRRVALISDVPPRFPYAAGVPLRNAAQSFMSGVRFSRSGSRW
jgi:hypothetical protein